MCRGQRTVGGEITLTYALRGAVCSRPRRRGVDMNRCESHRFSKSCHFLVPVDPGPSKIVFKDRASVLGTAGGNMGLKEVGSHPESQAVKSVPLE